MPDFDANTDFLEGDDLVEVRRRTPAGDIQRVQVPFSSLASAATAAHNDDAAAHGNAGAKKLDRILRIATFGDSTATISEELGGSIIGCNREDLPHTYPVSGFTNVSDTGSICTMKPFGRLLYVADGGKGGEKVQDFLDRSSDSPGAFRKAIDDVIAKHPDVVELNGGSINDVVAMTPSTPQSYIDDLVAKHISVVEAFTGAGIHVIDSGIYGLNLDFSGNLALHREILLEVNAAWKLAAASGSNPLWHFVDMAGVTHDASGAFLSGMSDDAIHLNPSGGYAAGRAKFQILKTIYASGGAPTIVWDGLNRFITGGAWNPTGMLPAVSGATIVSRLSTASGFDLVLNYDGNSAADASLWLNDAFTESLSGATAGDQLALQYSVRVFSGTSEVKGTLGTCRILLYSSDNARCLLSDAAAMNGGELTLQRFAMPAELGSNSHIYYGVRLPAVAGQYRIRFAVPRILKIA